VARHLANSGDDAIGRANLDGTGAESVIGGENLFTFGVAVNDTHVYN
jgi:hypothetical protein